LNSPELKPNNNNASIDFPSRARFLEQDIVNYINSSERVGFSGAYRKHLQEINYARSCALELAIKHNIQRALLLVLSLDLILLVELLGAENAKNQYGLHYLISTREAGEDELVDPGLRTKEEIDFIFSKDEMQSILRAEKGLLAKKDTTLMSCIGSLLAHARSLSRTLGWVDVYKELSNVTSPSVEEVTNLISQHNLFGLALEVIHHNDLSHLIVFLESNLLACECLDLSYVTDRVKIKNRVLYLSPE
jgi:hypothetical protein